MATYQNIGTSPIGLKVGGDKVQPGGKFDEADMSPKALALFEAKGRIAKASAPSKEPAAKKSTASKKA